MNDDPHKPGPPREEETTPLGEGPTGILSEDEVRRITQIGPGAEAGDMVGPYRLIEKLGEGGMGEVWVAEQQEPIRRKVAFKVIKRGMDSRQVVARFESERQAIALMDHPNIAKVYDAGSTPSGLPYFVMEHVQGVTLREHCDQHFLNTRQRLELFMQVCDGVQHAHQKAIIHRDLKSSNVLVAMPDDRAVPKIIDFGVAKAMEQELTQGAMQTEVGQLLGTPEYMSPEQADMSGQNIDTRTDVYSLGVLLYQLLVGALPFDASKLWKKGFHAVLQTIREVEPPTPSQRLSTLGDSAQQAARVRRTEIKTLQRQLRGDLDWIVMKALEKDRARRYGSPFQLASDIGRYLTDEPVLARPPSRSYRVGKFVKRHTLAVGAAAALIVVLVVFAITMAVQARRIAAERDRANREASAALQVSNFLADLFKVSDPSEARGNSITAREILDVGAGRIRDTLIDQPEVQARLMATIGTVYGNLGLYPQADPLLEEALEARRRELGEDDASTLATMRELAIIKIRQGDFEAAEQLFIGALEGRRRTLGDEHPETMTATSSLASFYLSRGRTRDAEPLYLQALAGQRRIVGDEDPATLKTMNNLAVLYRREGRYDEAEPLYRTTLDTKQRVLGEDHPSTLNSAQNLAILYINMDRYEDAESLYLESLEIERRVLGEDHPHTLKTMHNLGESYRVLERYDEAEPLLMSVYDVTRRTQGEEHPDTLESRDSLASLYKNQGRYDRAERYYRELLDAWSRVHGEDHPKVLQTLTELIDMYARMDRPEAARPYTARLIDARRRDAESSQADAAAVSDYARLLLTCDPADLRDPAGALTFALRANEMADDSQPGILQTLALALFETGEPAGAIAAQKRAIALLPESEASQRAALQEQLARFEAATGSTRR